MNLSPMRRTSLYLLAREMRGSPKVVLQGDGGDEMFAGYRRYAYYGPPLCGDCGPPGWMAFPKGVP